MWYIDSSSLIKSQLLKFPVLPLPRKIGPYRSCSIDCVHTSFMVLLTGECTGVVFKVSCNDIDSYTNWRRVTSRWTNCVFNIWLTASIHVPLRRWSYKFSKMVLNDYLNTLWSRVICFFLGQILTWPDRFDSMVSQIITNKVCGETLLNTKSVKYCESWLEEVTEV